MQSSEANIKTEGGILDQATTAASTMHAQTQISSPLVAEEEKEFLAKEVKCSTNTSPTSGTTADSTRPQLAHLIPTTTALCPNSATSAGGYTGAVFRGAYANNYTKSSVPSKAGSRPFIYDSSPINTPINSSNCSSSGSIGSPVKDIAGSSGGGFSNSKIHANAQKQTSVHIVGGNNNNHDDEEEEDEDELKISFMNFKAGSIALFVPVDASKKTWMAFHSNKPNRFLSQVFMHVLCAMCVYTVWSFERQLSTLQTRSIKCN